MKYDNLDIEHMNVEEISHNEVVRKKPRAKLSLFKKKKKDRDVFDYVMLQMGIACGILGILLAVNVMVVGVEPIKAVFTSVMALFQGSIVV